MGFFDIFKKKEDVRYIEIFDTMDRFNNAVVDDFDADFDADLIAAKSTAYFTFFFGAFDCIVEPLNLSDAQKLAAFTTYARRSYSNGSKKGAQTLAELCNEFAKTEDGMFAIYLGEATMDSWKDGVTVGMRGISLNLEMLLKME